MSSLLATASPWNSTHNNSMHKKPPSMSHLALHRNNKTQKSHHKKVSFSSRDQQNDGQYHGQDQDQEQDQDYDQEQEQEHDQNTRSKEGFAQMQSQNNERIQKVESILEQMNHLELENDGQSLANFQPIPRPELQPLDELESKLPLPPKFRDKHDVPNEMPLKNGYLANDPRLFDSLKTSSSYETSYQGVPYYAKMGQSNRHFPSSSSSSSDNPQSLLIEKINYMIHLLEQQQYEKTDNILEEFFLYLLLGGFMIYVVDSFTKTGKYIR